MNPETLKYLQQDELGKVIAKGLASLYTKKPQRPITYLAEWLQTYSNNRKEMAKVVENERVKEQKVKMFEEMNKIKKKENESKKEEEDKRYRLVKDFKNMISNHEYHEELLTEVLPEFVEKFTDITGAYIGELNHPQKEITDEDTEELSHLNLNADKVINYIGSSVSHSGLMRGKILKLNEGVTAQAFTLLESAPVNGEEEAENAQQPKEKYIYIPNVVKNESIHYFKIPKLGAYLAVPLVYQSFLSEKIFDEALSAKKKELQELEEFQERKREELEELKKNKEELEKRLTELKEKNAEESQIEGVQTELSEVEVKVKEKESEEFEKQEPSLNLDKRSYVVCVDNIGKDRQLSANDIDFINDLVEHFRFSWESKEKELLIKDVMHEIEFLKTLPDAPETLKEELEKIASTEDEHTKEINQIEEENERNYKFEEHEVKTLREAIKQNKIYLECFLKIKDFRVVKFKEVIQNILYFLGEVKSTINVPHRTTLNWKFVRSKYITEQTFNQILDFEIQGPKQESYEFYRKTPLLLETFEKFNEEEIWAYNPGLAVLVHFIKKALKHRISNVQLRKAKKEVEREERKELIEDNEKIEAEKLKALETQRASLSPEELESWKEEEWIAKYEEEFPTKEVPPEIVDDIDNDM